MSESFFSNLSDDVILNILQKLEDDPRHWARVTCVSTKFASLIRTVCCRAKCSQSIPAVVSDLIPYSSATASSPPPGAWWSSLYKLAVCCPGLLHAGVLLENSDFGLERELGPDEDYHRKSHTTIACSSYTSSHGNNHGGECCHNNNKDADGGVNHEEGSTSNVWSLYDDLMFDTLYSESDSSIMNHDNGEIVEKKKAVDEKIDDENVRDDDAMVCKRRKISRPMRSHLASRVWDLSREQGNKLLASRFKGDSLYICDWPGCVHVEEKRNYMLFRGVFKNFKQSRVWRTINDGCRKRIDLNCAFCASKETWDLHSSFCLRRYFGFHDDGEPVVRAYVCENGHVSGAWTDWPLYN